MHCEQVEALLARLVFGELDEPTKRAALLHLSGCKACKDRFLEMRAAALLVKEGVEAGPAPVLSAGRKQILLSRQAARAGADVNRVRAVSPGPVSRKGLRAPRTQSPTLLRAFGFAAAFLLVCGILFVLVMSAAAPKYMRSDLSGLYSERSERQLLDLAKKDSAAGESAPDVTPGDRIETDSFAGRIADWFTGADGAVPATPPAATRPMEVSKLEKKALQAGGQPFGWQSKAPETKPEADFGYSSSNREGQSTTPSNVRPHSGVAGKAFDDAERTAFAALPAPSGAGPAGGAAPSRSSIAPSVKPAGESPVAGRALGEKQQAERVFRYAESDHNETANVEDFKQAKGNGKDFLSDKPLKGDAVNDVIGVGDMKFGSRSGGRRMSVTRGGGVAAPPAAPEPALPPPAEGPAVGLAIVPPGGGTAGQPAPPASTPAPVVGRRPPGRGVIAGGLVLDEPMTKGLPAADEDRNAPADPGVAPGKPAQVDSFFGLADGRDKQARLKSGSRLSSETAGKREAESLARQVKPLEFEKAKEKAEYRGRSDQRERTEEAKEDWNKNVAPRVQPGQAIREGVGLVQEMAKSLPGRDEKARRELGQQDRYEQALDRLQEGEETSRPALAGATLGLEETPPPFVRLKPQEAAETQPFALGEPRTPGSEDLVKTDEGRKVLQPAQQVLQQQARQSEPDEELPSASLFKAGPVNPWVLTARDKLSTFALAVDTASYALARRYLQKGFLPPAASVRMEEFVNAFDYNYPGQTSDVFAIHVEGAPSPFRPGLTLLKVGVKGKVLGREGRKPAHLVFVIDGSGSMARADRLPLIQYALRGLAGQLGPADRVSVVVFGTEARLAAEAVPAARRAEILAAIESVQPSGPTNLLLGLQLGYGVAQRQFRAGEINRVILCTDGVANIGSSDADEMLGNVKAYRDQGVTFTAAGFGTGSYNDALLARLAAQGDGRYVFIDSAAEARRVFVEEMAATLQSIAVDAKIQVEFDPARVRRYRLIGYEARSIRDEDFRNDTIEAAEVGSGQSATALYEVELVDDGAWMAVDDVRAGTSPAPRRDAIAGCLVPAASLGTVYVRYRNADTRGIEEIARRMEAGAVRARTVEDSPRFFLAASVAEFAELLRESEYAQGSGYRKVAGFLAGVSRQLPLDKKVKEVADLAVRAQGLTRAQ